MNRYHFQAGAVEFNPVSISSTEAVAMAQPIEQANAEIKFQRVSRQFD